MAQLKLIKQVNCKLRCYIWGNVVGTYRSLHQPGSVSRLGQEIPWRLGFPYACLQ